MPDILEIALDDEIRTDRFFNGKRAAHPTERVPLCAVKTEINHRSTRSGYTSSLDSNVPQGLDVATGTSTELDIQQLHAPVGEKKRDGLRIPQRIIKQEYYKNY